MGTSKSVANATASVVAASKQCMKMTEESKLVAVDYSQLSAVQVTFFRVQLTGSWVSC